jgi:replication factor C small subunit
MPLLNEKYRPKVIEDIIGFEPTFSIDEDMPHLLFYGSAGTGKTTAAKAIVRMLNCDYIILNASEERGIQVVRDKIQVFAGTQSKDGNIKCVILDEADFLTQESQTALRNILESFSRNTRFILTCNYLQKIIDPIQSRCILIKFNDIKKEDVINRLEYICKTENIPYEKVALEKIVEYTGTDIRSSINKLEEFKDGVFLDRIKKESKVAEEVFVLIQQKKFELARQTYLDGNIEPEKFMRDLHDTIFDGTYTTEQKQKAILIISEEYRWLSSVAWPQILIESLILKLMNNF